MMVQELGRFFFYYMSSFLLTINSLYKENKNVQAIIEVVNCFVNEW